MVLKHSILPNNQFKTPFFFFNFLLGDPSPKLHISLVSNILKSLSQSFHRINKDNLKTKADHKYKNDQTVQIGQFRISMDQSETVLTSLNQPEVVWTGQDKYQQVNLVWTHINRTV